MVGRQLHHKAVALGIVHQLFAKDAACQIHGADGHGGHQYQHQRTAHRAEEDATQHRRKGQRRAAGDAPHQQHRQKALPGVVNDAASRDARQCGYVNQGRFAGVFYEEYHVKPLDYRCRTRLQTNET